MYPATRLLARLQDGHSFESAAFGAGAVAGIRALLSLSSGLLWAAFPRVSLLLLPDPPKA